MQICHVVFVVSYQITGIVPSPYYSLIFEALYFKFNQLNQSITKMPGTITVDEALQKLGGFGLFQWLIYIGASITEMAVTYQIFLLTFITAEPKWVCKNESLVCNFTEPIGLTDDDYNARCDMPRSEWEFADDFTSIVTEVCLA